MAGSKIGGLKAAAKNKAKDPDFYKRIGSIGGKASRTGGFYYSMINGLDTHVKAGQKGGRISKRTKNTYEDRVAWE